MKSKFYFLNSLLGIIICGCVACGRNVSGEKNYEPVYSNDTVRKKVLLFGVPSQSYYELTDLFTKFLNEHLKAMQVEIQTVASSSFLGYDDKLRQGYFHFTIANGMSALKLEKTYSVIGKVVDEKGNSGVIVVNRDSSIHSFSDLKGKTIATPGSPALPGHILQMVMLSKKGIDVNKDIKLHYFESFESVFLNVYLNKCSAGFATTTAWNNFIRRRPEITSKVVQKWQTPSIIGNAFLVRNDLDKQLTEQLRKIILTMHESSEGKIALAKLGYLRFEPASINSYDSINEVVKDYNATAMNSKY